MSNLQEQIDKLNAAHAEKVEQLQREYSIRDALPQDVEPHFVHAYKLYGSVATVKYGNSYRSYNPSESEKPRALQDALALLARIGEIVPFFIVKDSCTALKPEAAITEREREHASVSGPYVAKIVNDQGNGASLEAFVKLPDGRQIYVEIILSESHRYGGWRRIGGNENYAESWRFDVVPAQLGQAQLIRYASGAHSGPRSGSRQVYVFAALASLDALVAKQFINEHVVVARVGD